MLFFLGLSYYIGIACKPDVLSPACLDMACREMLILRDVFFEFLFTWMLSVYGKSW